MPEEKVSKRNNPDVSEWGSSGYIPVLPKPAADAGPRQPCAGGGGYGSCRDARDPELCANCESAAPPAIGSLPAANAGPRQSVYCNRCHHIHIPGEQCYSCIDPDNQWSTNGGCEKPPVPQEAAPQPISYVETAPGIWQGPVGPRATAPDWAMRVARQPDGWAHRYHNCIRFNQGQEVNAEKPSEAVPYWLGTPGEAGSERECGLEDALRNLRDRLQIIMAWPDEHWSKHLPIEIESELAEASRLLGGES